MPARLPDFEYDIFISYRHNANLPDGWVTEFVTLLQEELAGNIKGNISIYFDKDHKDGLGDNHLVGPSLAHRLRSLILIPVISRTYCDTERFSWQHEFLPFLEQAQADRLGLTQTLLSRNVSSRVLPVRIHNLDPADEQLLEKTLNSPLRSIDFVYDDAGVNRPLRAKDDDLFPSASGPRYRNKLSLVANAVKDLLEAMQQLPPLAAAPAAVAPAAETAPAPLDTPAPAAAPATEAFLTPLAASPAPAATPAPVPAAAPPVPAATSPAAGAAPAAGLVAFLPWASKELVARREELAQACTRAGMRVVPNTDCPLDEDEFRRRIQEGLATADCALHLLGNKFGRRFEEEASCSLPMYAYQEARRQAAGRPAFRQFVWYRPDETQPIDPDQQAFVNAIRNELTAQCVFTNSPSALQLAADVRSTLEQAPPPPVSPDKENDIFFIFNNLDSEEANAITDRLSAEFPLEILTVKPDSDDRYKDITVRTIPRSKLAVVYFKHSADWALPFVKQVWRLVGGASSTTPILFVGEDDPEDNRMQSFKAPKVISRIEPHLGVSEEVRRVFQQITNPS